MMTIDHLTRLAGWVWEASWHGAVVVGVVLLFRWVLGRRLPAGWRCWLWGLVAMRLVMFVAPQASWSLFGIFDGGGTGRVARSAAPLVSRSGESRITVGYGPAAPVVGRGAGVQVVEGAGGRGAVSWGSVLALVWMVGAVGLVARGAYSRRLFLRRVGGGWRSEERPFGHAAKRGERGAELSDADIVALLEECRRAMGVARGVEVIATSAVGGPALFGVFRPRILIPPELRARLSREELRFVFLHELAHLRCWDVLAEWFVGLLTALHWFNPAVWLGARFYRADRELARDAMVLRVVGRGNEAGYGNTLLRLLEAAGGGVGGGGLAVSMLGEKRALRERIRMIADLRGRPARLTLVAVGGVCVVIAVLVMTNPRRRAGEVATTTASSRPVTASVDDLPRHLSTVVYDVRDLVDPVRDYDSDPEHPVGRRGGATRPVEAAQTEAQITASLVKLIRETVDPESWNRARDPGTIRVLDGQGGTVGSASLLARRPQLIVTQDGENQRAVAQLLGQLRETRTLEISTSTDFVVLDRGTLPKDHPALGPLMAMDRSLPGASDGRKLSPTFLSAGQREALLKFVSGEKDVGRVRAAPVLKTANGQRAFVKVATSRAFVADLKVVRDERGMFKSYEPVVEAADSGLTVDLQGTVSTDRKFVTVSVRPLLTKLLKLHTIPFGHVPADHPVGLAKPTVQQPEMLTTEAETTCSIPDGETLVMSLGTDCGVLAGEGYVAKAGEEVYMLVTPRITRTEGMK